MNKKIFTFCTVFMLSLPVWAQQLQKPALDDMTKFTSVGNIGLTISNFGTFGHAWSIPDQPSCEYPKDSGVEHLYVGGLWVGALKEGQIRVTTGAVEYGSVSSLGGGFEFTTEAEATTIERSQYPESPFYDPNYAVSHQDFVADFTDTNTIVPGTTIQIPQHNPLGIAVHMETYAWDFPFADDFVIFNYQITNVSDVPFDSLYVGMWADLVVRNTNLTPPRIGSPFYQHGGSGKMNDYDMIYCYDYDGDPPGTSDSYVAMRILGGEQPDGTMFDVNSNFWWWTYRNSSGDDELASPSTDPERYHRLKNTTSESFYQTNIVTTPGNRMSFISAGPFKTVNPGETFNAVFAIICAPKSGSDPRVEDTDASRADLVINAEWAATAYHGEDKNRNGLLDYVGTDSTEDLDGNGVLTRYVLPTPPTPPRMKVVPGNGEVTLLWDETSEKSRDLITGLRDFEGYRIYRSQLGEDFAGTGLIKSLEVVSEYDIIDGIGYDTGLDSIRLAEPITDIVLNKELARYDTITYYYSRRFSNLINGWQYVFSVTAFDSGDVSINLPGLESSNIRNATYTFPGTPPPAANSGAKVGVYPNPYRAHAIWDGDYERQRKIYFYNLPATCEVRIYTLAGDMIDSFRHDSAYDGGNIQWFQNFSGDNRVMSGGEHAWDMVTADDQAIATGLYLFTVKDLQTGDIQKGKFAIIK
jgi:hypothetical protein